MNDKKTILLAFMSICLVCTWVYHLVDKTKSSKQLQQLSGNLAHSPASELTGTVNRIVSPAPGEVSGRPLHTAKCPDSSQTAFNKPQKVTEPVEKKQASYGVSPETRKEIETLQTRITALAKDKNYLVQEKTRLNSLLAQLSDYISKLQKQPLAQTRQKLE